MNQLTIEHLSKEYPTPSQALQVLRDVSLQCSPGQSVAILGPSGSGKSTLLQIVGALDTPTSGTVKLGDTIPHQLDAKQVSQFRNEQIGFVFQEHHLLPHLSVMENVLLPTLAWGQPDHDAISRARQLIDRVGLSDRSEHLPRELSGGQRGRVALARALINQPLLVLADEPTGNLDGDTAHSVGQLLVELLQQDQAMLIVATHSPALAAMMQRRFEIRQGSLIANN